MNYRKDEYIRAHNPFPRQPDVAMKLGVCANTRVDGEPRTIHAMPPASAMGRKVKVLKSGVRRISYK